MMDWYSGAISNAVAEARQGHKLLLVYIEGSNDSSLKMTEALNNPTVAQKLVSSRIIALKITENSVAFQQFCAVYPVLVIPTTYFLGPTGTPIEIVTSDITAEELLIRIEKVFQTNDTSGSIPSTSETSINQNQPSTSGNNQNHELPSTSQNNEVSPNLTAEEKIERARKLIQAQQETKIAEQLAKEKENELNRREMAKAMQKAEQTKRDREMQDLAKSRAKEKEEDRLARERVKAMIAEDRANKAAQYQKFVSDEAEKKRNEQLRLEQERASANATVESNDARIQFRLPDGSHTTHTFSADASLDDARKFVAQEVRPPFSNFSLCTPYPTRHFVQANYSESLRDLQLTPSAVLLILPVQAVTTVDKSASFLISVFWSLMTPFTVAWNLVKSFFSGRGSQTQSSTNAKESNSPQASTSSDTGSMPNRQATEARNPGFYRREGNVHRMSNQSDDDDNNTYNGNSTQQM